MTRDEIIHKLDALVKTEDVHNEVACGELLKDLNAASVLLPLGVQLLLVDSELRTSSGDVDLLVCTEETLAGGQCCRRIYVWELKAPQVSLFRAETNGRAAPTAELYSAENQLIHYYCHIAGSEEDRRKFGVLSADDVRLGGIIIGSSRSFVATSKDLTPDKVQRLAVAARDIRERTLYRYSGIRLLTWDGVLDNLRTITASHVKFEEVEATRIPLNEGPIVDNPDPDA